MATTKRQRILLASILKPVDDPRMFEKFAHALSLHYHVHVFGLESRSVNSTNNVTIFSNPNYSRKGWRRVFVYQKLWQNICQVQPDLLIIHAVELLPLALLFRVVYRKPICYDMRENYALNIRSQQIYPWLARGLLASLIRAAEYCSQLFIANFFYAEKSYADDIPFLKRKGTLLENKYQPFYTLSSRKPGQKAHKHCVMAGTISEVYGARAAVSMVCTMRAQGFPISLTLAGNVIEKNLLLYLQEMERKHDFISLLKGSPLLSHHQLLETMMVADFILLSYEPNPSTARCIPTKLYECLALKIPMIIQENPLWEEICKPFRAGIFINFDKFEPSNLYTEMIEQRFYTGVERIEEAYWGGEGKLLIEKVREVID